MSRIAETIEVFEAARQPLFTVLNQDSSTGGFG